MQTAAPLILQVEDEENIRKLISVNLEKRGYRVLEAHNGQQGLDHLRDVQPDLLILNMKLPDISGMEILEHLNEKDVPTTEIPVILISAYEIDKNQIQNQHPRVVKIFTKPFDVKEVIEFIYEIVPHQ